MGTVCRPNTNPRLARVRSALINRTHGVLTGTVTTAIRKLPSAPCFERAQMSGDETFARRRTLVSDSMNDRQWSEDLSNPRHIRWPF